VLLGIVAIIAVIGLVLLFTRASTSQGALLTDLSIGNTYGAVNPTGIGGIAPTYPTPAYDEFRPQTSYPAYAYPTATTGGTRTPAFVISGLFKTGGYASIEDVYSSETDLQRAGIFVPHDLFNCYTVPNKGASPEVTGRYPPASSAYARPTKGTIGKTGGDVYCFANSVGAEAQFPNSEDMIRDLVLQKLVDGDVGKELFDWGETWVNGKRVAVAWQSAKTFPYPQ
jgi:hypothetical protein